ncbi:CGNR zinc finger domain-containing protein [Streptomyces sp. NBC_01390]
MPAPVSPPADASDVPDASGVSGGRSTRHSVLANARRAAALVNALTSGGPASPDAIGAVLRAHGEPGPLDLTAHDVGEMREAALLLREVFGAGDVDRAAGLLNRLLLDRAGPLRLTSHEGRAPWHPHVDRDDDGPWGEWFLGSSCLALAVLVWEYQRPPGAVCASMSCENVFVTQGRGPERHYCSRRCATRERVAAHRRARSGGAEGGDGPLDVVSD